ncbi:alpha/beta hydrolase [Paenibacillus sp. FSL R7-0297]|uniref:alpha/beta fold hydrolase n=1 Tax=Paenibacillus sp. FSL R7-0297 TaxID=2921680 RepID=UPI0030FCC625
MERYIVYNAENNDRTVVVLPALGERKEIYAPLAAQMETVRIIAIDLPGHNREDRADADIGAFVREIKGILDELQISEAHLVGNSIGAWIGEAFYAEYPAYVKSLTLLDGGYYFLADREEDEGEILLPVIDSLEELEQAVDETILAMDKLAESERQVFKDYLMNNFYLQGDSYMHHSREQALNRLSKEVTATDYCLKQAADIPLILLLAEESMDEFSLEKMQLFKVAHPDADVKIIGNGYHFLPITNAADVAAAMHELLSPL